MGKQKIDIMISSSVWDPKPWKEGMSTSEHVGKIHVWPTEENLENVEGLLVWKPLDEGVVDRLPNLKWVSSIGAGVDHLVNDPQIPEGIPITRIVDEHLTRDMTNYVIMGVLMYQRSMSLHRIHQHKSHWERIPYHNLKIGVMGLGELGLHCAQTLVQLGFDVSGYSRSKKDVPKVKTFSEDEQEAFLSDLDILVNLLPVTPKTDGILNKDLFKKMKTGAYLINVARGNHLVELDLIEYLNSNHLSGALLDVFNQEPLPADNPLWEHEKITITPHVASVTNPQSAINLLKENVRRLLANEPLLHQIDRKLGY